MEPRQTGWRQAAMRAGTFILALLPALVLAYAVMALVWPWSVAEPLNPFRALIYFSTFFENPWRELFGGSLTLVPDMPRRYVPQLFALELPEITLALGLGGIVGALAATCDRSLSAQRRAVFFMLALAAAFPIALAVATRPAMEDRGVGTAPSRQGRARTGFRAVLGSARRRLRARARRILLRRDRRAGRGRDQTRRRRLCAGLRHPGAVDRQSSDRAGPLKRRT